MEVKVPQIAVWISSALVSCWHWCFGVSPKLHRRWRGYRTFGPLSQRGRAHPFLPMCPVPRYLKYFGWIAALLGNVVILSCAVLTLQSKAHIFCKITRNQNSTSAPSWSPRWRQLKLHPVCPEDVRGVRGCKLVTTCPWIPLLGLVTPALSAQLPPLAL